MQIRTVALGASIALAGLFAAQLALAQYPAKPVRVPVADSPGSVY